MFNPNEVQHTIQKSKQINNTDPIKVLEQHGPYQGAPATRTLSRGSSKTNPIKVLEQHGPYQGARATRSLSWCSSNTVPIKVILIGTLLLEHLDRVRVALAP
jgi:hypothetical protein